MNAIEYDKWKDHFFVEYEKYVREWLVNSDANIYMANNMPFFRDGVVCSEKWFSSEIRPLFILKEVNTGLKTEDTSQIEADISGYNEKWGVKDDKFFRFVENEFDDIRIGKFATWKKIARLAIKIMSNDDTYKSVNLNATFGKQVAELYPRGYQEGKYVYTTGNKDYIETVNHIAVIDIKKIGAGDVTDSLLSLQGKCFLEHLHFTRKYLIEQICSINPTDIICCCGPDNDEIYETLSVDIKEGLNSEPRWYKVNHPSSFRGEGIDKQIEFCKSVKRYEDMG